MAALDLLQQSIGELALGVPLAVRVSPRARRLSLRVDPTARGIELVLPRRFAAAAALDFVARHRGWIAARIAALPPPARLADGASVPVFGVPHRIRHVAERAAAPVAIADGEIRVRGDPVHLPRRVVDHLKALARRDFAARARALADRLGKRVTRVGVRDPKSRWGSCSAQGALSFSWRLVLAPEPVIHYVVAHEVAHLVEMNHSPHFWRLVESLAPEMRAARTWLKRHRAELHSYGA